jgi:hypothetical protein
VICGIGWNGSLEGPIIGCHSVLRAAPVSGGLLRLVSDPSRCHFDWGHPPRAGWGLGRLPAWACPTFCRSIKRLRTDRSRARSNCNKNPQVGASPDELVRWREKDPDASRRSPCVTLFDPRESFRAMGCRELGPRCSAQTGPNDGEASCRVCRTGTRYSRYVTRGSRDCCPPRLIAISRNDGFSYQAVEGNGRDVLNRERRTTQFASSARCSALGRESTLPTRPELGRWGRRPHHQLRR